MKKSLTGKTLVAISVILAFLFSTDTLLSQESELLKKVSENDITSVKSLIASGADVNYQKDDMMGSTAINLAQDTLMMKVLIDAGADINHQNKMTGYTPLMNALNGMNKEVAGFLLREGADVNIKTKDGTTALILACGVSAELSRIMIEKGADIHAKTERGMGVFTQCTMVGISRELVPYEFAEYLLSKGADIDEANKTDYYLGYTPLFWAVESGDEKLVKFLVDHGAKVNLTSGKGKTPLSIALEGGKNEIAEILKAAGAK